MSPAPLTRDVRRRRLVRSVVVGLTSAVAFGLAAPAHAEVPGQVNTSERIGTLRGTTVAKAFGWTPRQLAVRAPKVRVTFVATSTTAWECRTSGGASQMISTTTVQRTGVARKAVRSRGRIVLRLTGLGAVSERRTGTTAPETCPAGSTLGGATSSTSLPDVELRWKGRRATLPYSAIRR